ncbi:hypothetical protein KUTeg_022902 [Tegillarca granosa]|uniref:VCBS repeat-containing protein n=1 Tax=Tegillarca granosa TaxID=220873 RepID=A0ABQ9E5M3_TEGGR|nr:hypothetical protein KUTeg_022902 [Tegillarca granosa]
MSNNYGFILTFSLLTFTNGYSLQKLGSFPISFPAFTNFYPNLKATTILDRYDLLISTFDGIPFSTDSVQIVEGIGNFIHNVSSIKPKVLTNSVTWPNEISGVPEPVFNRRLVAIPDGFLVPFKTDGSISIIDISQEPPKGPYKISGSDGWFYHRVIWKDMDNDGDFDILTCRAKEPIIGIGKDSELLWFENKNNLNSEWTSHVLDHGPDIYFRNIRLQTPDGVKDCILTAQFFTKKLAVYWTNAPNNSWTDTSQIKSRVIDDTIGSVFEVQTEDLNSDGKVELLVTNNGNNGSIFVYEIPNDFRTKPSILLSGDDNGRAYLLVPTSASNTDWSYNLTTFLDAGDGTVGELTYADVDNDGFNEVFVPSYSTNELFVFKFMK